VSKRERRRRTDAAAERPSRVFIALTLLIVVLLGANLVAFYTLHPPPIISLGVLVVLGGALFGMQRLRNRATR
jgi:CHASE2 domain-containing sensor protein